MRQGHPKVGLFGFLNMKVLVLSWNPAQRVLKGPDQEGTGQKELVGTV